MTTRISTERPPLDPSSDSDKSLAADSVRLRGQIGYLPGELSLYGELTGRQLLALFADLRRHPDLSHALELAERFELDLLAATSLNLATCPLSQPLEVADTRARIQDEVLDGSAHPQLVLRVGWVPTSAVPIPQSPRRSLHDTVTYLPGTGPRIHER